MDNVYRFITDLGNYINLMRITRDVEIEKEAEPSYKDVMRTRYDTLFRECVNMHRHVHEILDKNWLEIEYSIKTAISKRDLIGQISLRNELLSDINRYKNWLVKRNENGEFSMDSVYKLRVVRLEDTEDGTKKEVVEFFNLSLHFFAEKLNLILKRLQYIIDEKFKFLELNEDLNKKEDFINKNLHCFSGYWNDTKIMKDNEYARLIIYATETMDKKKVPSRINPIATGYSNLSKEFYKHSIYKLWKDLKESRKHEQALWIDFLKKVFKEQYIGIDHDLSKSFSRYQGHYENDKALIKFK